MRHKKKGRKLNMTSSHRKLMFRNMINSFIHYELIKTTLSKAKELRILIEKIVTRSKKNNLHNKRILFSIIRNKKNVNKLLYIIGPKYIKYNGGYTKILKCGFRNGDNAPLAYIKFLI